MKSRLTDALRALRNVIGGAQPLTTAFPVAPEVLLDLEGYFWAPETPERRVRGRLRWTRQIGELQLEQILRVVPAASTDNIKYIRGRSLLGEPLCLTDCHVRSLCQSHPKRATAYAYERARSKAGSSDRVLRCVGPRPTWWLLRWRAGSWRLSRHSSRSRPGS